MPVPLILANTDWSAELKPVQSIVKLTVFILLLLYIDTALAKPRKVVSINLCTDQLLMLLADRKNIASVSYLAAKPDVSAMVNEAEGIPQNRGLAEEILLLQPDLILAGTFTSRPTVFLLKRLGFNVVELPVASNFNDIRRNIVTVSEILNEQDRGKKLITVFNKRLSAALSTQDEIHPIAVFYRENSYTTGGNTLANTILKAGGFSNLAAQLGISGSGHMPLETLITQNPDIIISGRNRGRKGSVAAAAFQHPAFKQFKANKQMMLISEPLWVCGTPFVLDAVEHLVAVRQQWQNSVLNLATEFTQ